jgi:hypothetical protein
MNTVFYYIIIALAISVLFFGSAYAELKSDSPQYGVALSKNCVTMLINHMKTNCPTYDQILKIFPDNTNPKISGDFKKIDGITQREKSPVKNNWFWYYHRNYTTFWVDPPSEVRPRINMIIIESSLPEYKTKDSLKMDDYSISFGKDLYIGPNCKESRITAANWLILLPDMLNVAKNNCDTSLLKWKNGTVTKQFEKSFQDRSTSAKYQDEKYKQDAKKNYTKSKIGSNDKTKNPSVTEDRAEKYKPIQKPPFQYPK